MLQRRSTKRLGDYYSIGGVDDDCVDICFPMPIRVANTLFVYREPPPPTIVLRVPTKVFVEVGGCRRLSLPWLSFRASKTICCYNW